MSSALYLAIPLHSAESLLYARKDIRERIAIKFAEVATDAKLREAVVAIESVRVAATPDGQVLGIWDLDYLPPAGVTGVLVVRIREAAGLLDYDKLLPEVFERVLQVAECRADGLLLPAAFIHKQQSPNVHTCLAARGKEGRQLSLGYSESTVEHRGASIRLLTIAGPARHIPSLCANVERYAREAARRITDIQALWSMSTRPRWAAKWGPAANTVQKSVDAAVDNELARLSDLIPAESLSHAQWVAPDGPLTESQRAVLRRDAILHTPVRLVGPAGSGKSLLLLLIAARRLLDAEQAGTPLRVSYMLHSRAMAERTVQLFASLGLGRFLVNELGGDESEPPQQLHVGTLMGYVTSKPVRLIDDATILGPDSEDAKEFQRDILREEVLAALQRKPRGGLAAAFAADDGITKSLLDLLMIEISASIKAHGIDDRRKYVSAEAPLSLLHGALGEADREFVYKVFQSYSDKLSAARQLDADDVAIQMLGFLTSPLWRVVRRNTHGFDFVFIDEAQLFSENEKRVLPLLSRPSQARHDGHVPVAIALDLAQDIDGASHAGFGLLGIEGLREESLGGVHRCTPEIARLAMLALQHTTELFNSEFPDYTRTAASVRTVVNPEVPQLTTVDKGKSVGAAVIGRLRHLMRRRDFKSIAVVIYADVYWEEVEKWIHGADLGRVFVLRERGQLPPPGATLTIGSPSTIGGQEFDAVVCVGVEYGRTPPVLRREFVALQQTLTERSLREMYVGFTRARHWLEIVNGIERVPDVLQAAIKTGVLRRVGI